MYVAIAENRGLSIWLNSQEKLLLAVKNKHIIKTTSLVENLHPLYNDVYNSEISQISTYCDSVTSVEEVLLSKNITNTLVSSRKDILDPSSRVLAEHITNGQGKWFDVDPHAAKTSLYLKILEFYSEESLKQAYAQHTVYDYMDNNIMIYRQNNKKGFNYSTMSIEDAHIVISFFQSVNRVPYATLYTLMLSSMLSEENYGNKNSQIPTRLKRIRALLKTVEYNDNLHKIDKVCKDILDEKISKDFAFDLMYALSRNFKTNIITEFFFMYASNISYIQAKTVDDVAFAPKTISIPEIITDDEWEDYLTEEDDVRINYDMKFDFVNPSQSKKMFSNRVESFLYASSIYTLDELAEISYDVFIKTVNSIQNMISYIDDVTEMELRDLGYSLDANKNSIPGKFLIYQSFFSHFEIIKELRDINPQYVCQLGYDSDFRSFLETYVENHIEDMPLSIYFELNFT